MRSFKKDLTPTYNTVDLRTTINRLQFNIVPWLNAVYRILLFRFGFFLSCFCRFLVDNPITPENTYINKQHFLDTNYQTNLFTVGLNIFYGCFNCMHSSFQLVNVNRKHYINSITFTLIRLTGHV